MPVARVRTASEERPGSSVSERAGMRPFTPAAAGRRQGGATCARRDGALSTGRDRRRAGQATRNDFRGPDVFVVLDTVRRERRSWVVWEEGGRTPDVAIELLSGTTEHVDRGDKMRVYARLLRAGESYLFDPMPGAFEGYALDAAAHAYRRRDADADGRVASPATGLTPWLRWIDAEGRPLPTGAERADEEKARADQEKARADAVKARADGEAARARELEAELAALRRRRGDR
ncbi:MAG TPA: Uma2 family endonuclease [Minicystis sp.]|nr:Uma2 family endonuclease [Minicystis sp.]